MTTTPTVVLLDPTRPQVVPLAALAYLTGEIEIDVGVPESARVSLPDSTPGALVTVMMDVPGPRLDAVVASGARIVRAEPVLGDRLVEAASIMDRLWNRGGWESTQTHDSLSVYLVEETYEVLDAIRSGDLTDLREELGDLLLQVLFQSRIAQSTGAFDVDDVGAALIEKLIHRSPHLETSGTVDIAEQERAWETLKAVEKARASAMDGIAVSQPAGLLAEKFASRAIRAGFPQDLVPAELREKLAAYRALETSLRVEALRFASNYRAAEGRIADCPAGTDPGSSAGRWTAAWQIPAEDNE
ncbi:MazG family protein [Rhodococcus sp. IEGM 1409]|uniref:MazG family protein n=1 Tax=Rhodococcus sp. IEGM 1409 TaxID=3047082 RepID=UPI0024B697E2|nr:MazG family protein [Rhodococcus sp. IEGM 1409]MDI9898540.1 MazG family protein [Rhodococcus sp. IEGM 1409]